YRLAEIGGSEADQCGAEREADDPERGVGDLAGAWMVVEWVHWCLLGFWEWIRGEPLVLTGQAGSVQVRVPENVAGRECDARPGQAACRKVEYAAVCERACCWPESF